MFQRCLRALPLQQSLRVSSTLPVTLLAVLLGCASHDSAAPSAESPAATKSIALSMSRKAYEGTFFEQYQLTPSILFHECGRVTNGRFSAEDQGAVVVDAAKRERIQQHAMASSGPLSARRNELAEAGDNDSLFDPGLFEIEITDSAGARHGFKTSVDEVSNGRGPLQRELRALTETLRESSGSGLCARQSFFGLRPKPRS